MIFFTVHIFFIKLFNWYYFKRRYIINHLAILLKNKASGFLPYFISNNVTITMHIAVYLSLQYIWSKISQQWNNVWRAIKCLFLWTELHKVCTIINVLSHVSVENYQCYHTPSISDISFHWYLHEIMYRVLKVCQDGSKNLTHVNSFNSHIHFMRGKAYDDSCFYSQGN